jgi:urease accessory protein
MIATEKLGPLSSFDLHGREIDLLPLEWHELGKRILHKRTQSGREVTLKFLAAAQNLQQDDVLHAEEDLLIAVDVIPCEAIMLQPQTMYAMALVCYEIGNKHLPLFYENETLLLPFDAPVYRMLQASGLNPVVAKRKLVHPLKTSVLPHAHSGERESLFSRILKLTTSHE